ERANRKIAEIKRNYKKDLAIETFPEAPDPDEAKKEPAKYFARWAKRRYEALSVSGIYVLICKSPRRIQFWIGDQTSLNDFTASNRKRATEILEEHLKNKDFDGGLEALVRYVDETLERNVGKTQSQSRKSSGSSGSSQTTHKDKESGG